MKIHCQYTKLVPIEVLKQSFNPKNANVHPPEQIDRLAKILEYQGVRYPAKISNQTKLMTSGHGRVLAAEKLGWKEFPVSFQDYENPDQETADLHADNAVASWSHIDLAIVNSQMGEFSPEFDLDMLGIKDFKLDVSGFGPGTEEDQGKLDEKSPVKCPNCSHEFRP